MQIKMKASALATALALAFAVAACAPYQTSTEEGSSRSRSEERVAPARAAKVEVPAGTTFDLETVTPLSSGSSQVGDRVSARLVSNVVTGSSVAIPAGTQVRGTVTEVVPLKKFGGQPQIAFSFDEVQLASGTVPMRAYVREVGKKQKGRDAAKIGAGAAAGAVAGHQVDDDKGSVIGAVVGGAVGTAIAATTGKEVNVPAGTVLSVQIENSIEVPIIR